MSFVLNYVFDKDIFAIFASEIRMLFLNLKLADIMTGYNAYDNN